MKNKRAKQYTLTNANSLGEHYIATTSNDRTINTSIGKRFQTFLSKNIDNNHQTLPIAIGYVNYVDGIPVAIQINPEEIMNINSS